MCLCPTQFTFAYTLTVSVWKVHSTISSIDSAESNRDHMHSVMVDLTLNILLCMESKPWFISEVGTAGKVLRSKNN